MDQTKPKKSKREPSALVKGYLFLYNVAQTVGWAVIFIRTVNYYLFGSEENLTLYETVKWPLLIFQCAAFMEVFHAIVGFVQSSPTVTLQQTATRVFVVVGSMANTTSAQLCFGFPLCMLNYAPNEVLRYGFYILNSIGWVPQFITWLRYTAFIISYPLGLIGEGYCMISTYQELAGLPLTTSDANFYLKHFLFFFLIVYFPSFFRLYFHMFTQRKKVLGKPKTDESTKKVK